MRLLFLTNFYPPHGRGGYEQWCQEVAEGLRERGHQVLVLTSRYGAGQNGPEPEWIQRRLYLEMDFVGFRNSIDFFTKRNKNERRNLSTLNHILGVYSPDMIVVWGMWNLNRSLAALAEEKLPGRVVYYMGDYWPMLPNQFETYWHAPARNWVNSLPKQLIKPVALKLLASEERQELQFSDVIFSSAFLRDEYSRNGMFYENSSIIYGGADTQLYSAYQKQKKSPDSLISLLYVGRLAEEKGVETCIQAMGVLKNSANWKVNLKIVGAGEKDYESYLSNLSQAHQVADRVLFLGRKPKATLPEIYHDADIFIFPSIWPEPFGRVLVEAMASGLPVVGTTVGGAGEILKDGQNGLTFHPGDPEELAAQVSRLVNSPDLCQQLANAGRNTAIEKFDIQRMVSDIEKHMLILTG